MNSIGSNGIDKFVPTAFFMTRSGTYQAQQLRSWSIDGNMHDLNRLQQHVENTCATRITQSLIAGCVPGMMQVSTGSQGEIAIPNGWNNQRGVFVLMLDVHYRVGTVVRWIVQGYTDEPSFTDRLIAPSTIFHINNIFSMTPFVTTHNGLQMNAMQMVDNFQMVNGFSGSTDRPGGNRLIRPQDVMSNLSTRGLGNFVSQVIDTSTMTGTMAQTSRHSNNIGSSILANTFNVWHEAASSEHASATSDVIAETAYGKLMETDPSLDVFMNILTQANQSLTGATVSFRFSQLEAAIPGIMSIFRPIDTTAGGVRFSSTGDSNHFLGQDFASKIAVNLQTVIPAIMVESLLAGVSFKLGNTGPGGALEIHPLNVNAFSPDTDQRQWAIFSNRIIREVVPLIAPPRMGVTFNAIISCNFFHEFQLDLNVMGQEVRFVSPTFCNSLGTPIQTTDQVHANNFATDMETAAMHVCDALMESTVRKAAHAEAVNPSPGSVSHPFSMPGRTVKLDIPAANNQGGMMAGMNGMGGNPPARGTGMTAGLPGNPQPAPSQPARGGSMTTGLPRF